MTREEIENIPETVDCLLDESVLEQTRATLKERLKEIGDLAIKALEQEPKTDYKAFAEWVAGEIFSAEWEFNKDSFAEVACRKLEKLGLVKVEGKNWVLEQEPTANANTPHLTVDEYIRTRKNRNDD